MVQGKANPWIHVLFPALLAARRALGDAPARSLSALAQRLGISEADAAPMVVPLEEAPAHRRELRHLNDGNSNQHGDSSRMVSLAHDTIFRRYSCWSSPIILSMSPRRNRPS